MNDKQKQFLELFEPCRANLSRFCNAIAGTKEDAKDLAAETIAEAYRRFDSVKQHKAFVSFLFSIASRTNSRLKKRQKRYSPIEAYEDNWTSSELMPDTKLDIRILYKALDKLPKKQKEAIVLFEISGFSLEEIRGIQGGTLSGVKSRLKRGRENLKEILNEKKTESLPGKIYKVTSSPKNYEESYGRQQIK